MKQLSLKAGDSIVVDGCEKKVILKFDRIDGRYAAFTVNSPEDVSVKRGKKPRPKTTPEVPVETELKDLAESMISLLSEVDSTASQELLTRLVSDLFYAQAQKRQKEERLTKQSEGIAAAKARGVRFGPKPRPLPENFEEYREAWCDGQISLRAAAKACGMSHSSFHQAVFRTKEMQ